MVCTAEEKNVVPPSRKDKKKSENFSFDRVYLFNTSTGKFVGDIFFFFVQQYVVCRFDFAIWWVVVYRTGSTILVEKKKSTVVDGFRVENKFSAVTTAAVLTALRARQRVYRWSICIASSYVGDCFSTHRWLISKLTTRRRRRRSENGFTVCFDEKRRFSA